MLLYQSGMYRGTVAGGTVVDGLAVTRKVQLSITGTVTSGPHTNLPVLLTLACLPSEMFDADAVVPGAERRRRSEGHE